MTTLLKVFEVAEQLRCDPQTVRSLVRRGLLRAIRVGRVLRIPAAALDELPPGAVNEAARHGAAGASVGSGEVPR